MTRPILIALFAVGSIGTAHAADGPAPPHVELTPFDIANASEPSEPKGVAFDSVAPGTYKIGDDDCELSGSAGSLTFVNCPPLQKLTNAVTLKLADGQVVAEVALRRVTSSVNVKYVADVGRRTIAFAEPSGINAVALYKDRWISVSLDKSVTGDADVYESVVASDSNVELFLLFGANVIKRVAALQPQQVESNGGVYRPVTQTSWCSVDAGRVPNHTLVCLQERDGRLSVVKVPRTHVLPPNKAIAVVVQHSECNVVSVSLSGNRGLTNPVVANYTPGTLGQQSEGSTCDTKKMTSTVATFAPRQPGSLDLNVQLRKGSDPNVLVAEHSVELLIEQGYLAAIRLGFGIVGGGAVDRSYAVQLSPGAGQAEVRRMSSGLSDVELVLGFSPFIWEMPNGRQYITGRSAAEVWLPTPYFGLGLIGDAPKGLTGFRSIYLGLEWEPVRSFALAVCAVGRRVTRLADGIRVGDPASDGSSLTEETFKWGFGIVISVSPDFLSIAAGSQSEEAE